MRRIGVEVSPAVCSEGLYRDLGGSRALRDRLRHTVLRLLNDMSRGVRVEVIDDSLRDKEHRENNRQGQEQVVRHARDIDEEVTDSLRRVTRNAAN